MTRFTRPGLLILSAFSLVSFVGAQRVALPARAALMNSSEMRSERGPTTGNAFHLQSDAKKIAETKPPVVRELDVAGLKKLLTREGDNRRPLLINFWATWCEPCRAEFPDLVKIDEEYSGRGLDFVAVSIDDVAEINTTVPRFLQEMRARMPAFLLNTLEPEVAIAAVDPQWSGSLPATFLYDAQGKVVYKHLGRIKPDELRAAIKTVLK